MSNVFKFDPKAIRERKRLNEKAPPISARDAEKAQSRKAWLLFFAAVILLTVFKAVWPG